MDVAALFQSGSALRPWQACGRMFPGLNAPTPTAAPGTDKVNEPAPVAQLAQAIIPLAHTRRLCAVLSHIRHAGPVPASTGRRGDVVGGVSGRGLGAKPLSGCRDRPGITATSAERSGRAAPTPNPSQCPENSDGDRRTSLQFSHVAALGCPKIEIFRHQKPL